MVDAIVGKWRSDPSKTVGFEEFRDATDFADKWPAQPETVTLDITRNGNEWSVTNQREGTPAQTVTLKEGEKKVTQGFEGNEVELQGQVEGDRWVVVVNTRGNEIHSSVYVDGGELVQEQTLKGVTLITRFNRI